VSLPKELLEIVVCPRCKGPLTLQEDEAAFTCSACRLVYAVVDGIPNFLIEEARPLA
jgi:uncharacterized protein